MSGRKEIIRLGNAREVMTYEAEVRSKAIRAIVDKGPIYRAIQLLSLATLIATCTTIALCVAFGDKPKHDWMLLKAGFTTIGLAIAVTIASIIRIGLEAREIKLQVARELGLKKPSGHSTLINELQRFTLQDDFINRAIACQTSGTINQELALDGDSSLLALINHKDNNTDEAAKEEKLQSLIAAYATLDLSTDQSFKEEKALEALKHLMRSCRNDGSEPSDVEVLSLIKSIAPAAGIKAVILNRWESYPKAIADENWRFVLGTTLGVCCSHFLAARFNGDALQLPEFLDSFNKNMKQLILTDAQPMTSSACFPNPLNKGMLALLSHTAREDVSFLPVAVRKSELEEISEVNVTYRQQMVPSILLKGMTSFLSAPSYSVSANPETEHPISCQILHKLIIPAVTASSNLDEEGPEILSQPIVKALERHESSCPNDNLSRPETNGESQHGSESDLQHNDISYTPASTVESAHSADAMLTATHSSLTT